MNWDEINEIEKSEFGYIGHHSHTHEYLIDMSEKDFIDDIETAIRCSLSVATKRTRSVTNYVQKILYQLILETNFLYVLTVKKIRCHSKNSILIKQKR